jgi:DNA-binding transcriptional ArsR family regulator
MAITKALSDETRVRALLALRKSELCLCQIVELLGLAPSTVSKHLDVLYAAGLVARRKDGRWHYFRLAGKEAQPVARQALRWVLESLDAEPRVVADAQSLVRIRKEDPSEFCACYRT